MGVYADELIWELEVAEVGRVDGQLGGDDDLVLVRDGLRVVALDTDRAGDASLAGGVHGQFR